MPTVRELGVPYTAPQKYQVEVTVGRRKAVLTVYGRTEAEAVECARHTYVADLASAMLSRATGVVLKGGQ